MFYVYRSVRESRVELRRKEVEEEENVDEESDVEPDVERGAGVQPARSRDDVRRSRRAVADRAQRRAGGTQRRSSRHQRAARPRHARRARHRRRVFPLERAAGRAQRTRSLAHVTGRRTLLRMTDLTYFPSVVISLQAQAAPHDMQSLTHEHVLILTRIIACKTND